MILSLLSISAVSAAENNVSVDVIGAFNNQLTDSNEDIDSSNNIENFISQNPSVDNSQVLINSQKFSQNNQVSSQNDKVSVYSSDNYYDSNDSLIKEDISSYSDSDYGGRTIEITEDNYGNYFNKYTGNLLPSATIYSGDIVKIGNVTNKVFVFDRKVTVTTITPDDKITNGAIHLLDGSDGSIVTGLNIYTDQVYLVVNGVTGPLLHAFYINNANNLTFSFNKVKMVTAAGYAMYIYNSSYDKIVYNDLYSGNSDREKTICMAMGLCNYNNISYNSLRTIQSNVIYFNPGGWAGAKDVCIGNYISNNYVSSDIASEMSYGMQLVYGYHNNTTIVNNTIFHVCDGINLLGENLTLYGNKFINMSQLAASIHGVNILIENNTVDEDYTSDFGITSSGTNVTIIGNLINIRKGAYYGIGVTDGVLCVNNTINMGGYGKGISVSGNNTTVITNIINTFDDPGISVSGSNNLIKSNTIYSRNLGISVLSPNIRLYNNSFILNTIDSESYGIYLDGLIYNSTIGNNIIRTNASTGIYKHITDEINDDNYDNIINGIIFDPTAIIINDTNFYEYFTEEGYLNATFKENTTGVIFLTFLTNKDLKINRTVFIMSNFLENLLIDVTINFLPGSEGSVLKDLNFYNINKNEAIILSNVNHISVTGNNITVLSENTHDSIYGIYVEGLCNNCNIENNNIYINSKSNSYGIGILSFNKLTNQYSGDLSKYFTIKSNNIMIISHKIAYGFYTDSLGLSMILDNTINLRTDSLTYGIMFNTIIGSLTDLNITDNIISIYSKAMTYIIALFNSNNVAVKNNTLFASSNGVYGVAAVDVNNLSIINNRITTLTNAFSGNECSNIFGLGNSALFINGTSDSIKILANVIDTNTVKQFIFGDLVANLTLSQNKFVIGDYNYLNYFTDIVTGVLIEDVPIKSGDTLLLANLTLAQSFSINIPLDITRYKDSVVDASISLVGNASNSKIYNLIFENQNNFALNLINVSNVTITNNTFRINTNKSNFKLIQISNGSNNTIDSNWILINGNTNSIAIEVNNVNHTVISNNIISNVVNGSAIAINIFNGNNSEIINNTIFSEANIVNLINSVSCINNSIGLNNLIVNLNNGSVYNGENTRNDVIVDNIIKIQGINSVNNTCAGIHYSKNSMNNSVLSNKIVSSNINGDYAVYIDDDSLSNFVVDNYLLTDNELKRADFSIYAPNDNLVENNTPYYIYVSSEGNDIRGDGSLTNPYKSIAHAISCSYNKATIYLLDGTYYENNLIVNHTLTLSAINAGKVLLNLNNDRLFNISYNGYLTVIGISFTQGSSINGSVFFNNGKLNLVNSKFYNNKALNVDNKTISGFGAVITNNGELTITGSEFYNNFAHKGGVIMNYGKITIENSRFVNNSAVEGGVIYNGETNCSYNKSDYKNYNTSISIYNSTFLNNSALKTLDFCSIYYDVNRILTSNCCDIGYGGVIATLANCDLIIDSSLFEYNSAFMGGVVAFITKYRLTVNSTMNISNSTFNHNTVSGSGGVIYGTINKSSIIGSNFTYNEASSNGGAISATITTGSIDNSIFVNNKAYTGGALSLYGNITITNTIISNNTAVYSGGIDYKGDTMYSHIINHMNIFNSTIEGNRALNEGGAIGLYEANITISNSNIVNNFAPSGSTFRPSSSVIYAPYNYWGNEGPDNSVWNGATNFRPWLKDPVNWGQNQGSDNGTGSGEGNGTSIPGSGNSLNSNTGSIISTNPNLNPNSGNNGNGGTGTGTGTGTGSGNGTGGPGNGTGNGTGTGSGDGISNSGDGTGDSTINGNGNGTSSSNSSNNGNGGNSASGLQSLINAITSAFSKSTTNSTMVNSNLLTVGVTANAMDASSKGSSQGGGSGGGSSASSASSDSQKSYELKDNEVKKVNDPYSLMTALIVALIFLILVYVGYKQNKKD